MIDDQLYITILLITMIIIIIGLGFHTPAEEMEDTLSVEWAVNRWLSGGVPKEKLVMGLATYGRTFTLKDRRRNGVGSAATGSEPLNHFNDGT